MTNWLDPFLKAAGHSQESLADALDVSRATINRLAQDHSKLKKPRAEAMAPLLGTSVDDLMLNRPPAGARDFEYDTNDPAAPDPINPDATHTWIEGEGPRDIPADASAQIDVTAGMGGGGVTIVAEGVPGKSGMTFSADVIRDYWRLPGMLVAALGLRAKDIAVIEVQGNSMAPTLDEGDFVFIDTRHRWPSPDGLYALADEFGGIIVKRLELASRPGSQDKIVRVISDNTIHQPKEWALDEIQIIGRVMRRFTIPR
ncbi:LexA family transcriptional regulator [Pelagibacterium sp. H642]|uniref:LexA family transcriptional regulator n=1 Tax=Pelagibacterium sp. H642 TaxID=1881069 RepID=UPI002815F817|nr:LexA family transcriptional regulator [Pelagibacterium sp. H642]WMT90109.1 LexA family transcriptional regulator [Pelagibacterium sp. H642]